MQRITNTESCTLRGVMPNGTKTYANKKQECHLSHDTASSESRMAHSNPFSGNRGASCDCHRLGVGAGIAVIATRAAAFLVSSAARGTTCLQSGK